MSSYFIPAAAAENVRLAQSRRASTHTFWQRLFVVAVLVGSIHSLSGAEPFSGEYSTSLQTEQRLFAPYIVGNLGYQAPSDKAYDTVFSKPLFVIGGGFGVKTPWIGAEFQLRQGTNQESHILTDVIRVFSLKATEVQARFFAPVEYKRWNLPAGIGIGLIRMTVDRGYPGTFDSFSGDGLFVGPFVGVEYRATESFSIGVEVEYALSSTRFESSQVWQDQYGNGLDGRFPVTEDDFWDTVGGMDSQKYDSGGLVISTRFTFDLPRVVPGSN